MTDDRNAVSTETREQCECCFKWKTCRLYVIATLETAWICKECRKGKQ